MSFSPVYEWFRLRLKWNSLGRKGKIFSLWLDGEEKAPEIVRLNLARWRALNPDYKLIVLDEAEALKEIGAFPMDLRTLSKQAFSDVLRIKLLAKYGGIWIDATVFPVRPLSEWLPSQLTETKLFLFANPGPDRRVSSWFIVAPKGSYLVRSWAAAVDAYWGSPTPLTTKVLDIPEDPVTAIRKNSSSPDAEKGYFYFWFHYLFAETCDRDPACSREWSLSSPLQADDAHRLQVLLAETEGATEA